MTTPSDRRRRLELLIQEIDVDALHASVANERDVDPAVVAKAAADYIAESRAGLQLIDQRLRAGQRLLEIGAGIGLLSSFLALEGFDVVAIEPSAIGFELMDALRRAIDQQLPANDRQLIDVGIDDVGPGLGSFDLIYSVNVIEHLPDVKSALSRIAELLATEGISVHSCPNYFVPYEPHFGIPLLPFRPTATAKVLPRKISETGLWRSLNFVTASQIRTSAADAGLSVKFQPGVMANAFNRLSEDEEFAARQSGIAGTVGRAVRFLRLETLLAKLPAGAATPMEFELRGRQSADSEQGQTSDSES